MKAILTILISITLLLAGCAKKPLTLDENTSMKTLLKASDEEITELVMKEVKDKMDLTANDVSVVYILRDKENQALAVKISKRR